MTKEELRQRHHKYYESNKEKIKAKTRAYAQTEYGKQIAKESYQKNRTKRLAYQKVYQQSERGKEVIKLYLQRKKLKDENKN